MPPSLPPLNANAEEDVRGLVPNANLSDELEGQVEVCTPRAKKRRRSVKPGRIRVRCIGAANIAAKRTLFGTSNADAYAVVSLVDHASMKQSPAHRTRRIQSCSPKWREDFWFCLNRNMIDISLHVEVWHRNEDRPEHFLGEAELNLQEYLFQGSQSEVTRELELRGDGGTPSPISGNVKVEIALETDLLDRDFLSGFALLRKAFNSPQALRMCRIGLLGSAALLLLVSRYARWLCIGSSLAECQTKQLAGATTCVTMASVFAASVALIHFAGSAGLFGRSWTGVPVNLLDLLDTDFDQDDEPETRDSPVVSLQVLAEGRIVISTAFFPKLSFTVLRIVEMFAYLAATLLCVLGVALAVLESGPNIRFGEAMYLDVSAIFCLFAGWATSLREWKLLVRDERNKWRDLSEEPKNGNETLGMRFGFSSLAGAGIDSPALRLEEVGIKLEKWARNGVENLTHQAETLTQPLLDAGMRLQEQIEDTARPVREGLQHSIDILSHASSKPRWLHNSGLDQSRFGHVDTDDPAASEACSEAGGQIVTESNRAVCSTCFWC